MPAEATRRSGAAAAARSIPPPRSYPAAGTASATPRPTDSVPPSSWLDVAFLFWIQETLEWRRPVGMLAASVEVTGVVRG